MLKQVAKHVSETCVLSDVGIRLPLSAQGGIDEKIDQQTACNQQQ